MSRQLRLGHHIKILSALFALPCYELKNCGSHDSGAFNILDLPPTAPIWEGGWRGEATPNQGKIYLGLP